MPRGTKANQLDWFKQFISETAGGFVWIIGLLFTFLGLIGLQFGVGLLLVGLAWLISASLILPSTWLLIQKRTNWNASWGIRLIIGILLVGLTMFLASILAIQGIMQS